MIGKALRWSSSVCSVQILFFRFFNREPREPREKEERRFFSQKVTKETKELRAGVSLFTFGSGRIK
jgi:hypothetical protein